MSLVLSAPKVVLLAAQLAAGADIDSLAFLASHHSTVLRKELLLRILLTYLPGNLATADYVSFVQEIDSGQFTQFGPTDIDSSHVEVLTDDQASKKVRKLGLRQLSLPDAPPEVAEDPIVVFLIQRAYSVDESAGSLVELPDLVAPFLERSTYLRTWMISTLLPLLRRNCEYYPENPIPRTLSSFERLSDAAAADNLLSQTGLTDQSLIGRDLRGLIGPWLHNEARWTSRTKPSGAGTAGSFLDDGVSENHLCPGWEQVLRWLTNKASKSWKIAVSVVEQWDGPGDVDLGGYGTMWLDETEQEYLEQRYARAALASAYLITEASVEALTGIHAMVTKIMELLGQDPSPPLRIAASLLPPMADLINNNDILSSQNTTYLRNNLLNDANVLTAPSRAATDLLQALVYSAFILTKSGSPCTVKRAGELALLQNEREQKAEAAKVIHLITENGPKTDDKYWIRARNEILWLRDWGAEEEDGSASSQSCKGIFGQVKREFLEVELLKALLANTRYSLARSLYEESPDRPLAKKLLQDTVFASAMNAYDNASNPNRTRGGLLKCDDIIHAFPETIEMSLVATQRIEALLKATHALGSYRLVLKQGQPFAPVDLRVHKDPISIIGEVLKQNPTSYTRIQDLLDLGTNMVEAGLTVRAKTGSPTTLTPEEEHEQRSVAEKRITAMCIDAALNEDDFETAYSYVVNRLAAMAYQPPPPPAGHVAAAAVGGRAPSSGGGGGVTDEWSWKAALQAGTYKRTERSVQPTHLGTGSANAEIRHLDQRIECLSTALRIAPLEALQSILNTYRRCEEELDSAVKAEADRQNEWDAAADEMHDIPGAFRPDPPRQPALVRGGGGVGGSRQSEEAPLSLFDLSRATARAAQRNFPALSTLQKSVTGLSDASSSTRDAHAADDDDHAAQQRVRKRDQLRDAAMGTFTSGVGWLIGAQPVDRNRDED